MPVCSSGWPSRNPAHSHNRVWYAWDRDDSAGVMYTTLWKPDDPLLCEAIRSRVSPTTNRDDSSWRVALVRIGNERSHVNGSSSGRMSMSL